MAADLVATYTRRTPVPADPAYLLLPTLAGHAVPAPVGPGELPDDATVCRCNGVSKAAIATSHHQGAATLEEVAAATRASTGCGGCGPDVCALLDWLGDRSPAIPHLAENHLMKGKHMMHTTEITAG